MLLKGIATILFASICSLGASLLLNHFPKIYTENWWISLVIFIVMFITLNFIYNIRTNYQSYSEMLFGTIAGKAFILLIIIFLYSVIDKKGLFRFSMHFIAHYILFTVFEMRYLLLIIKNREVKKQI